MITKNYILSILKSTYAIYLLIVGLLLFLFKGIMGTYAYTDGYEFIWNSKDTNFMDVFLGQGRAVSGWIISVIYPYLDHVSDLSYLRILNLICLLLASVMIYRMLIRNNIKVLQSLAIVIVFICSPFSTIVVHWEAASSCIWGYPVALFSGELVFTTLLNQKQIVPKYYHYRMYAGTLLGIISLFIYQPAYTVFIFPAFLHFITGKDREVIWNYLVRHVIIYVIYFLLFKLLLNQLHIIPNNRAGLTISAYKFYWYAKGAFFMSLRHAIVFASNDILKFISAVCLLLMGYFIYTRIKSNAKKEKLNFISMFLIFYILAYFPSLVSVDNWVSYRTMGTVTLLSSTILVFSLSALPLKSMYINLVVGIIAIVFIGFAHQNNTIFTGIQSKEYQMVKNVIEEKLKQGFPKKIHLIMPEENFLPKQKLVINIATDEFGKLSNSVGWCPKFFVSQLIYELTNNRSIADSIEITYGKRSEALSDIIDSKDNWVLDVEKIYLSESSKNHSNASLN